jgi:hypothetical protein
LHGLHGLHGLFICLLSCFYLFVFLFGRH